MHDGAVTLQAALTLHNFKPKPAQILECHGHTVEKVLKQRPLHFVQLRKIR